MRSRRITDPNHPANLTPQQRLAEFASMLARAVIRLHQRVALHKLPTSPPNGQILLDSRAEIPLSVAGQRHNG